MELIVQTSIVVALVLQLIVLMTVGARAVWLIAEMSTTLKLWRQSTEARLVRLENHVLNGG